MKAKTTKKAAPKKRTTKPVRAKKPQGKAPRLTKTSGALPMNVLRFDVQVNETGRIDLNVPLPEGTDVAVFVVEEPKMDFADLVFASQSNLGFWDNPIDDAEWNNA